MHTPPWDTPTDRVAEARRRLEASRRRRAELAEARAYGVRMRNDRKRARLAAQAAVQSPRRRSTTDPPCITGS